MMKKILRTAAAAEYVGLAPSTLEKMRLRGGGPSFIRIGGRAVGYDTDDLDRWLDGQRERSGNPARSVNGQ
jgi:predicted DNA-binding transcriptional regulator AlpA